MVNIVVYLLINTAAILGTSTGEIPSPIYPYMNSLLNTESPTFIWRSVSNADSYHLVIKKNRTRRHGYYYCLL